MQNPPGATNEVAFLDDAADVGSDKVRHFDLIAAIILTACTAFWGDLVGTGPRHPYYLASVLTSIGLVMPLALRRRRPLVMTVLMAIAGAAQVILIETPTWSLVAVPISCYSVARWVSGHESRLVVITSGLGSIFGPLRWSARDPLTTNGLELLPIVGPLTALSLAWVVIPYLLGRRDREAVIARTEREAAARERYEAELIHREQQTRVAESRVRNEIARELHDVVAHSLSVMIVQANGGKALARKQPEAAAEVLDTISATGREALSEMRRIVGVLRSDPESPETAEYRPAPGLSDIATMVANAGDRVQLSVSGGQPAVSAALGVTAYRVVQEGLTNFLKHAGPDALATVAIVYQPTTITIEVADDGLGDLAEGCDPDMLNQAGPGYGLQGMAERVQSMGGKLSAKPGRRGGWIVRATLPLTGVAGTRNASGMGNNGTDPEKK